MPDVRTHRTRHEVIAAAPAGVLYGLIADAVRWPLFFPPTVHMEQLEFDGRREHLRVWATANGRVSSWTSVRTLDPEQHRVEFRQEVPDPPVLSLTGTWIVEPLGAARSWLVLLHEFSVAGDAPDDVAWVRRATESNSRTQLDALAQLAERWTRLDELVLSFEDSVRVNGPAELVYDFLYRAADWPGLVPNVSRVDLIEETPGVQRITADGTESVRICFPHAGRILFKQTTPTPSMAAHIGEWSVDPDESGVTVTARHTVLLNEEHVGQAPGDGTDLAEARRRTRGALGRDSVAVLALAKQHAESAVRVL